MDNYNSIPQDIRDFIERVLNNDNNLKKSLSILWQLLKVQNDQEEAEEQLQVFVGNLEYVEGLPNRIDATNRKIIEVFREGNMTLAGLPQEVVDHINTNRGGGKKRRRKTGKKRRKTSNKRSNKRKRKY
jgi:hypothetical protein